jgi:hypothetical protein
MSDREKNLLVTIGIIVVIVLIIFNHWRTDDNVPSQLKQNNRSIPLQETPSETFAQDSIKGNRGRN